MSQQPEPQQWGWELSSLGLCMGSPVSPTMQAATIGTNQRQLTTEKRRTWGGFWNKHPYLKASPHCGHFSTSPLEKWAGWVLQPSSSSHSLESSQAVLHWSFRFLRELKTSCIERSPLELQHQAVSRISLLKGFQSQHQLILHSDFFQHHPLTIHAKQTLTRLGSWVSEHGCPFMSSNILCKPGSR